MKYLSILSFTADLEAAKKQVETEKKAKDELIRERDILSKVGQWFSLW